MLGNILRRAAVILLVLGVLSGSAGAFFLSVRPLSPDGATVNSPVGSLLTTAGTWTLVSPANASGEYPIALNGIRNDSVYGPCCAAVELYTFGGVLYQHTSPSDNQWYSFTGAGPWAGPVADPRPGAVTGITPTAISFSSGTGSASTQIATMIATMSSGSFAGSWGINTITGPSTTSSSFTINSSTGVLSIGTVNLAAGTYTLNAVATPTSGSAFTQNITITGSAGGAVPAPAASAGFNTKIIDDNFQLPFFATNSNWLDCAAASTPLYWNAWVGFPTPNAPCSAIGQTTDPKDGQLSMKLHWQDSWEDNGCCGGPNLVALQTTDSGGNGRQSPRGFYLRVVARTDFPGPGYPNPWMGLWSLSTSNNSNGGYEIDGAEEANGTVVTCNIHNPQSGWDSSCGPDFHLDSTQNYHTYAWRQTSAGSDVFFCMWVGNADGTGMTLNGCQSIHPISAQLSPSSPMAHQFDVDGRGSLGNGSTGKNVWVRKIEAWSCAGLNSGNLCNSSTDNPAT